MRKSARRLRTMGWQNGNRAGQCLSRNGTRNRNRKSKRHGMRGLAQHQSLDARRRLRTASRRRGMHRHVLDQHNPAHAALGRNGKTHWKQSHDNGNPQKRGTHPPGHGDEPVFQWQNWKSLQARGETLPIAGGFDTEGNLTCDPGAILDSKRALPIGYWKGSALANRNSTPSLRYYQPVKQRTTSAHRAMNTPYRKPILQLTSPH